MKKLKKILIVLIGLFPLIVHAKTDDEIKKWRWYTLIEENIHYESDVENICEDFEKINKDNFILGQWNYQIEKPEEKEGREIEKIEREIKVSRDYNNLIEINNFDIFVENIVLYELEFLNKDGNKLDYKVDEYFIINGEVNDIFDGNLTTSAEVNKTSRFKMKFNSSFNIKDMVIKLTYKEPTNEFRGLFFTSLLTDEIVTNFFEASSTDSILCENGICTMTIIPNEEAMYNEPISIKTQEYKYRDKYYKCYSEKKAYIDGYFDNLDGFIKDENDFILEKISNINYDDTNIQEPIYKNFEEEQIFTYEPETIVNEELPKKNNVNNQVAVLDKNDKEKQETNTYNYIFIPIIILTILLTILFTVNVIKSRTK